MQGCIKAIVVFADPTAITEPAAKDITSKRPGPIAMLDKYKDKELSMILKIPIIITWIPGHGWDPTGGILEEHGIPKIKAVDAVNFYLFEKGAGLLDPIDVPDRFGSMAEKEKIANTLVLFDPCRDPTRHSFPDIYLRFDY